MGPAESIASLVDDVRRQREFAQKALDEAKQLDEVIKKVDDTELKARLEQSKEAMLTLARGLVANATHTSSSIQTTLTTITQSS